MFAWVEWCYQSAGELRFGPHRLLSTAGVQQGDPLGPLLFSLVLLEILDEIDDDEFCQLVLSIWFLDDGTLVGPRAVVCKILQRLITVGPRFGLSVNLQKCDLFWPTGDQSFAEFPQEIPLLEQQCGIELLGSPAFGSPSFFAEAVPKRMSKVLASQAHLADLDNPQV